LGVKVRIMPPEAEFPDQVQIVEEEIVEEEKVEEEKETETATVTTEEAGEAGE
jgi:ribosomal protein S3